MAVQKVKVLNSEYFQLAEFVRSETAKKKKIDNDPSEEVIRNLQYGCDMVLDPLRRMYQKPIVITSGFRCPKLNKAVGGVANSWHQDGNAADIRIDSDMDAEEIFSLLKKIPSVDTALFEHSSISKWLHVQWNKAKSPRHHFNFNYYA